MTKYHLTGIRCTAREASDVDPTWPPRNMVKLTWRQGVKPYVCSSLTNGFSKKIENHDYAIALHFVYYNFVKQHKTLRTTPAMAAGLMKGFMSIEDIVKLVPEKTQGKRGNYKNKSAAEKAVFLFDKYYLI